MSECISAHAQTVKYGILHTHTPPQDFSPPLHCKAVQFSEGHSITFSQQGLQQKQDLKQSKLKEI